MDEYIFNVIKTFAAPAYVLAIMVSALLFVISGGSEERRKRAKMIFLYSTAGYVLLVVVLPVILNMVRGFTGI